MNKLTVTIIFIIVLGITLLVGVQYDYVSMRVALIIEAGAIGGAIWDVRRHA